MRPLSQTKTRAFEKFMDMFKITQLTRGVLLAQRSLAPDTVFSAEVLSSDGNGASLQWLLQVPGAPRLASYLAPGMATVHSQKIATAGRDREITGQRFGGAPCPWTTQPADHSARSAGEVRVPTRTPQPGRGGERETAAEGSHTCSCFIVSPPLPMTRPTLDAGMRSSWIVLLPSMSL